MTSTTKDCSMICIQANSDRQESWNKQKSEHARLRSTCFRIKMLSCLSLPQMSRQKPRLAGPHEPPRKTESPYPTAACQRRRLTQEVRNQRKSQQARQACRKCDGTAPCDTNNKVAQSYHCLCISRIKAFVGRRSMQSASFLHIVRRHPGLVQ